MLSTPELKALSHMKSAPDGFLAIGDSNGDGKISLPEFMKLINFARTIAESQADAIFMQADKDKNGRVTKSDLEDLFRDYHFQTPRGFGGQMPKNAKMPTAGEL